MTTLRGATGIGSLPGTDIGEAVKMVLGDLPDLPFLPELPDRGPGADMIGRSAGLLVELPVELYAGRWRIAGRPGRDLRRTHDLLERDLDTMAEQGGGLAGPIKVQAAGPYTLAANLDLTIGGRLLRDHGAVRDLAASLAEGLRLHVTDVARRLPAAEVVLQLDEPSVPVVLAGRVPTESGWQTLRAVEATTARDVLKSIVDAVPVPVVVHCCAADVPLALIRATGAAAVALDLDLLPEDLDPLGETIEGGLTLFAGAVPTRPPAADSAPSSADVAARVRDLWRRLGFSAADLPDRVVVTTACGLAGAPAEYARTALKVSVEAARRLAEE